MFNEFGLLPTSYFILTSKKCYTTEYKRKSVKKIIDEIMKFAGNTKTAPSKQQTVEEYLLEPQPHLNYLINASKTKQQIALRIWASTEGSISIYVKKDGYIRPQLVIACAHPDLAKQLQQIAQRSNIKFAVVRLKNNWSGIGGLHNHTICGCIEFLKLGGFIKGVKISANSKYYEGIEKNTLLLGILEFKTRQNAKKKLRNLSREKVHNEIKKISKNKEYKSPGYYVKYFS